MASKPYPVNARMEWWCKYKPDPLGGWVAVKLCKHAGPCPKGRMPKKPPQEAIDKQREFADLEYRAKNALGPIQSKAKGLAGYISTFLETYPVGHDPGTVTLMNRYARNFLAFAAERGIKSIQEVNKGVCNDYLKWRVATAGVKTSSLTTEKGYLSPIWSKAVDDEIIHINPWSKSKVPGKKVPSVPTFWTADEIGRLVGEARGRGWYPEIILLMVNTGIRVSATLSMAWAWVDWRGNAIVVPPDFDKAGVGYRVAMGPVARAILERRKAGSTGPLVFPSDRRAGPMSYNGFKRGFDTLVKKAGIAPGTPHDLRHTFARYLANVAPVTVVQSALGHASLKMTQTYVALDAKAAASHMDGFGVGEDPGTDPLEGIMPG